MIITGASAKNIFSVLDQIQLVDIHYQSFEYFGLHGIGNINVALTNPLVVSDLLNLATSNQGVKHYFDRVRSDVISKAIEG